MKNNKKIKSLTIIAVVLLLAATVAVSTGIVVNRVDASTQSSQEQISDEVLDRLNVVEEDDTDDTEETPSATESVAAPTTPAPVAPTTTSTTTKIDGEADVLKTNTEVENNGVSDTTSAPVKYEEKEATTVSGTTPSAPTAPAVKNESAETSSTTSTTSDTVRFDNNAPVHYVENTENQEVIVEEVTEIEEEKVSDELADLFG